MKKSIVAISLLFSFSCLSFVPRRLGMPIEQAMGLSGYAAEEAFERDDWKIVRDLYEQYVVDVQWSNAPRIPKLIHHIWLGSLPFPGPYKALRKTWKKHHPDWAFILWTDKEIQSIDFENKDLYNQASDPRVKSAIARYAILHKFGGLYVDPGFECLSPFDIFHHCYRMYTGAAPWDRVIVHNELIGAEPGHPFMKQCLDRLRAIGTSQGISAEGNVVSSLAFFTQCFFSSLLKSGGPIAVLPAAYFYPWPNYKRDKNSRSDILAWVRPETFAIHHWDVSWLKKTS